MANFVIQQSTVTNPEENQNSYRFKGDRAVKILLKTGKQHNRKKNEDDVTTAWEESGMYVKLNVGDIEAKFVINTGATLTLVYSKLYDMPLSVVF